MIYQYSAAILRVVDGDTVHADVDLGFDSHQRMTLRLTGIDAPEHGTPEGDAATAYLTNRVERAGASVLIRTEKDRREKYGRYLATIYVAGVDINAELVAAGHAVPYSGGKR